MKAGFLAVARYVLPVLGGLLAGAWVSRAAPVSQGNATRTVEFTPQAATAEGSQATRGDNAGLLSAMSARIHELERRQDEQKKSEPEREGAGAEVPALPDAEDARAHHEMHDTLLRTHEQEARDPVWARETARTLENQLSQAAQKAPVKLLNVDCRTNYCAATLEWPSRGEAIRTFSEVLMPTAETSHCARQIVFPDGSEDAPLRATAVFQCRGFGT